MVVMAIIAILATAGLSAYTGYLKKARDAVRIADINAINNIVLASMSATGMPPKSNEISALVTAANNGIPLKDPLNSNTGCMPDGNNNTYCLYLYKLCDGGTGYKIIDHLESPSNTSLLVPDWAYFYDIGSCQVICDPTTSCGATTSEWDWASI